MELFGGVYDVILVYILIIAGFIVLFLSRRKHTRDPEDGGNIPGLNHMTGTAHHPVPPAPHAGSDHAGDGDGGDSGQG